MLIKSEGWLSMDEILDGIVLRQADVKIALFKMFSDGWIECREVSRRADFSTSSTSYFWRADPQHIRHKILEHCYHTMLRLRIYRAHLIRTGGSNFIPLHHYHDPPAPGTLSTTEGTHVYCMQIHRGHHF